MFYLDHIEEIIADAIHEHVIVMENSLTVTPIICN